MELIVVAVAILLSLLLAIVSTRALLWVLLSGMTRDTSSQLAGEVAVPDAGST